MSNTWRPKWGLATDDTIPPSPRQWQRRFVYGDDISEARSASVFTEGALALRGWLCQWSHLYAQAVDQLAELHEILELRIDAVLEEQGRAYEEEDTEEARDEYNYINSLAHSYRRINLLTESTNSFRLQLEAGRYPNEKTILVRFDISETNGIRWKSEGFSSLIALPPMIKEPRNADEARSAARGLIRQALACFDGLLDPFSHTRYEHRVGVPVEWKCKDGLSTKQGRGRTSAK